MLSIRECGLAVTELGMTMEDMSVEIPTVVPGVSSAVIPLVQQDVTWASDIVGMGNICKCLNIWP